MKRHCSQRAQSVRHRASVDAHDAVSDFANGHEPLSSPPRAQSPTDSAVFPQKPSCLAADIVSVMWGTTCVSRVGYPDPI